MPYLQPWDSPQLCGRVSAQRPPSTLTVWILQLYFTTFSTYPFTDFNIHSGITPVEKVLQNWENILGNATSRNSGFIVLEHDLFEQAVEVATGYILPDALAHTPKFTIEPVITCLNKPLKDAYIETNDNKTNPPVQSGTFS